MSANSATGCSPSSSARRCHSCKFGFHLRPPDWHNSSSSMLQVDSVLRDCHGTSYSVIIVFCWPLQHLGAITISFSHRCPPTRGSADSLCLKTWPFCSNRWSCTASPAFRICVLVETAAGGVRPERPVERLESCARAWMRALRSRTSDRWSGPSFRRRDGSGRSRWRHRSGPSAATYSSFQLIDTSCTTSVRFGPSGLCPWS